MNVVVDIPARLLMSMSIVPLLVGCSKPETIPVVQFNGNVIEVPTANVSSITPIEWAMTIDRFEHSAKSEQLKDAFEASCQVDPELRSKVEHLFEIRSMIRRGKKARPRLRVQTVPWRMPKFEPPIRSADLDWSLIEREIADHDFSQEPKYRSSIDGTPRKISLIGEK